MAGARASLEGTDRQGLPSPTLWPCPPAPHSSRSAAGGSVASTSALMLERLDDEASGNQAELREAR